MIERVWQRRYDAGVPASIDYEPLTLPESLVRSAREHPGRTALVFAGRRTSYAELLALVERASGALAALGVGKDSRVAIHLPNLPQLVIAYHAALALGAQVVLTNPLYTDDELVHQWNDAGCTVAVVADWIWRDERLPRLRKRLPVRHWLVASIPELFGWPKSWLARRKLAALEPPRCADLSGVVGARPFLKSVRSAPRRPLQRPPALDDLAVLQYTGGTTGRSKGAMLSHRNLACNVQQLDGWFGRLPRGQEVFLAVLPYFHVFGLTVCLNHPLWVAGTIVLQADPRDAAAIAAAIAEHRVSVLALVPAMFHAITTLPDVESLDLTSVKGVFSGSAPLPLATARRFEQLTRGTIVEGYGLTETSPVTHCNPLRGERREGTIGLPVSDTDARIVAVDDASEEVAPGEAGELLLRGPQVMRGYWNAPEETAGALRDGWLHTGDLATMDAEGYFRIVGRKKELILCGGYNVYPDEVDRVLAAHPAVAEAATIGVPDARLGEIVKSFIVLRAGQSVDAAALAAYAREHLAPYKVPREIAFRSSLPRSTVLKVLRRELLAEELAARKQAT